MSSVTYFGHFEIKSSLKRIKRDIEAELPISSKIHLTGRYMKVLIRQNDQ